MRKFVASVAACVVAFATILFTADCDFSCSVDGCQTGSGAPPPPPPPPKQIIDVSPDRNDFNNTHEGATTPCFATTTSHLGNWIITYIDGTKANTLETFYFLKLNQSAYIDVDVGSLSGNWSSYANAAISVWSSALAADVLTKNSYYDLLPIAINDSNAPIAFKEVPLPDNMPGQSQGAIDPSNWSYIEKTEADLNSTTLPGTYDARYATALHELGHAMGLAHNQDIGSIMFPQVDTVQGSNGSCYFYNGSSPASSTRPLKTLDTSALEHQYDPTFDSYDGGGTKCYGNRCYQSGVRQLRSLRTFKGSVTKGYLGGPYSRAGVDLSGRLWIHYQDPYFAHAATLDELIGNSSLVILGTALRKTVLHEKGNHRAALDAVRVDQIIKSSYGPDEQTRPGQIVQVGDYEMTDGDYVDDPALRVGSQVVLFLRPSTDTIHLRTGAHVYALTYRYISKWALDSKGVITLLGTTPSTVKSVVEGSTLQAVFPHLAISARFRSASERLMSQRLLTEMGVRTPVDLARYRQLMTTNSVELLKLTNRRHGRPGMVL